MIKSSMHGLKIGCSGFSYRHWRGRFYPEDIPQRKWFAYYQRHFDTVEMNVTFYRLPKKDSFKRWYRETPEDFVFSIKGSRFITHLKRLKDVDSEVKNFFDTVSVLKEKLAVILWQFPPKMELNIDRLSGFMELIKPYPVKNTFEFRHISWITPEVTRVLKDNNCSYCMADWPEFNKILPITADFVYIRRHGKSGSYNTCYSMDELKRDATEIKKYLKKGLQVFAYFNNDANAYAPKNALELKEILGRPR
jgi:uncharacterized protein YecE (DUF72 family)